MLPGIGSSELFVIALVALIVVGPKDLPGMLRKLGQWVAKMRGMANEFRASFDEMARQSELDELRKEVEALRSGSYLNPMSGATDAMRDVPVASQSTFSDWNCTSVRVRERGPKCCRCWFTNPNRCPATTRPGWSRRSSNSAGRRSD